MNTSVQKWGNSLGVRIPNILVKELQISDGTPIEMKKTGNGILIQPIQPKKKLKSMLKLVTDENRPEEISFGKPVGKEVW